MRHASPPGRLALLLAHEAGLRAGSISTMTKSNCDFNKRYLRGKTKGGANYNVPMTDRLQEALLWACANAEPEETLLAAISYRRTFQCAQELAHHVRQAKQRAAIAARWTLHDLRRSAARRVYERTRDVRKVQRLMSHKNLSTTMWYLGDEGAELEASDLEAQPTRKENAA